MSEMKHLDFGAAKCVHSEPTEVATRFEIVLLARSDENF
jgi:hypothetical protein